MADVDFDPIAYINTPRFATWNFGLERIEKLLEHLGNPQDALRFVHVAGTNGKGSTCVYIASILQAAGYKTGLFTSPYIETFEERIRINGENIPLDDLREITEAVREAATQVEREVGEHPTEFELMTAVALAYFRRQQCDIAVLEVGLGGRLDSTNIIKASEVSVIARIGLDHTQVLGNTLAEIAAEKAGIIKPHGVVVNYPQVPEAEAVIREVATREQAYVTEPDFAALRIDEPRLARFDIAATKTHEAQAAVQGLNVREDVDHHLAKVMPLVQVSGIPDVGASNEFEISSPPNTSQTFNFGQTTSDKSELPTSTLVRPFTYQGQSYTMQLLGSYQPMNAALALEAISQLRAHGWEISSEAAQVGVARATWPGRFEVLSAAEGKPAIVVDGGHNPQGAEALRTSLEQVFPGRRVVFIMAALADKDLRAMIAAVAPLAKAFITAPAPSPRAASPEDLATLLKAELNTPAPQDNPPEIAIYPTQSYPEAARLAQALATPNDIICAFGSLYAVAEAKHALHTLEH